MNISIIVAIAENSAIGKDNKLLCYLPNDLKHFKNITLGHPVIMGRNTFLSLPGGALKNRRNIVITDQQSDKFESCEMVFSIEQAQQICKIENEIFIIGGASIYKQFLPLANKLYLTMIHHSFEADTFFPEINRKEWTLVDEQPNEADEKNPYPYSFITLQRKL